MAGGLAALLLMGFAGFYLFSGWNKDSAVTEELKQQISELHRMYEAPVHPGTESVDNIGAAKKQQEQVRGFLVDARKLFVPIPTYQKTDDQGFNNLLLTTIYELHVGASNAGVVLPPDFAFTFSAQQGKLAFKPGSIEPWTVQLSEIKTICKILYQAKVNAIEGMRRVPVSLDDAGVPTDYLTTTITTNDVAIVTPYEVTFRSFSGELGAVMSEILRATNCLIVKTLSVEPSQVIAGANANFPQPDQYNPAYAPQRQNRDAARYGVGPRYTAPPPPATARPPASAAPVVFVSEKPLKITLLIDVVKLKPQK